VHAVSEDPDDNEDDSFYEALKLSSKHRYFYTTNSHFGHSTTPFCLLNQVAGVDDELGYIFRSNMWSSSGSYNTRSM
jgi:hypothetical protein